MPNAEDFVEGFMCKGFMVAVPPQLSCWRMPSTPSHGSPLTGGGEGTLTLSPHEGWEPQEQHWQQLKVWGKAEGG